mgnify:CR=1 FL=1|jgi:hypothetical protein|tara:strand:- start:1353 stop:1943 length:591 start_codon:yes stop_codon:yes gene_type:complete
MKITVLATLFAGLLALNPAHAGSIDLLAIWSSDGVDADAADNGVADQLFCANSCGGSISAGDLSDIDANQFYGANGNVNTAQDHPDPDMINMLAFEGVVIPNLAGVKTENGFSGKSFNIAADFSGYITIKASTLVWLYLIDGDGSSSDTVEVTVGGDHDVSHYTEWAIAEVPLPAAAWLFLSGLVGLLGLRKSSKQ